jgi:hypothetical protein
MAETKAKKTNKSKSSSSKAKAAKPRKAKATSIRAKSTPQAKSSRNGSSSNPTKAVSKAVGSAGKDAGHATGEAVRKARIPLLAGGAALAGTIGGVVLGASRSGGKVLGVKLPAPKRVSIRSKDLAKAAKEIGRFGENVGDLTSELKSAREGLANGDGKHNSPIEVLLKGLTNRR